MRIRTIAFFTVLTLLLSPSLFAQFSSCDDLTNTIYTDAQIIQPGKSNPALLYSKAGKEILDVSYKNDSLNNKACSVSNSCADAGSILQYQVYYPDISYSSKHLPAIIFFHAGGFSDCSHFDHGSGVETYCLEFAKRGFVAFNVEYRRGRIKDPKGKYTSASTELATYRAFQDARGAIRTIVWRELNNKTPYHIDVQNIFVGGQSSGGDIALDVGFCTPRMIKQLFPGMDNYLGGIDANKYAGDADLTSFTIRGVLSMWGGFAVPEKYAATPSDFISENSKIPALIAFHGNADDQVDINSKDIFFSPSTSTYGQESSCLNSGTYIPDENGSNNADQKLLGSQAMYDNLKKQLNKHVELYIDCDMGHGLDEATSDFGLHGGDASVTTNDEVEVYIVERAATFFQYVMNHDRPRLKHHRFVECVNNRYGCNTDADNGCDNNAVCGPSALIDGGNTPANVTADNASQPLFTVAQSNRLIYLRFSRSASTVVTLYNLNGSPVRTLRTDAPEAVIDGSNLPSGIYVIQAVRDKEIGRVKVMLP